jgi:hypothetical protein
MEKQEYLKQTSVDHCENFCTQLYTWKVYKNFKYRLIGIFMIWTEIPSK